MPEFWDIYDENRRKTGRLQQRGVPMSPDDYHLVVEIWLMNPRGEVLLTKRHPDKHYGGLWECTGGSVLAGEESLAAALREVREETGVDLSQGAPGVLLASPTVRRDEPGKYSAHYDVYLFRRDVPLSALVLQPEEVVDAKWVSRAEYERMKAAGEVISIQAEPFGEASFNEGR